MPDRAALLRKIPQVERLLSSTAFEPLVAAHSRPVVTRILRASLDDLRRRAGQDDLDEAELAPDAILRRAEANLERASTPYYRRVINATGVVLHTALGRAPLAPVVADTLHEIAPHPVRVEMKLASGQRGGRDEGCAALLRELTGCEAATVVNNNAGATLLILSALARGKRVLLSRGEMVEIGGSYRIPEIMEEGGATLVGVGTTNRTHRRDYERAIDDETGMILKVHTSNYLVKGFTAEVEIEELVALGRQHAIPVVHDLGSGCLVDLGRRGIAGEPYVPDSVQAGADLVCFSGDKLLGGPQSGLIVGSAEAVERCRTHPLFRALRCDRLTYIALESTLRLYREGEQAVIEKIPALARLLADPKELRQRAELLTRRLSGIPALEAACVDDVSQAGSGSLPTRELPTSAVRVRASGVASAELARLLRIGDPSIVARIRDDALLFDVRTLESSELPLIETRFRQLAAGGFCDDGDR